MQLNFNIHYITTWGETLHLQFKPVSNHAIDNSQVIEMEWSPDFIWKAKLDVEDELTDLFYRYEVLEVNQHIKKEFGDYRHIQLPPDKAIIDVYDSWRNNVGKRPFYSKLFKDLLFKRSNSETDCVCKGNILLQLNEPQLDRRQSIAVVGSHPALGNWDVHKKIKLHQANFPAWNIGLSIDKSSFPVEYKFLVVDNRTNEVLAWEHGPNRIMPNVDGTHLNIITNEYLNYPLPAWKGAGVAIPVFSLRSKYDSGAGDFYDLKKLVDWAHITGMEMIQLLPVNDTTQYHDNRDSYPYNAVSTHALHPLYLNLKAIGRFDEDTKNRFFEKQMSALNKLEYVNYSEVMALKQAYCRAIFPYQSKTLFKSKHFMQFFEKHQGWLIPYAVFSFLRDKYATPDFSKWKQFAVYSPTAVEQLAHPDYEFHDEIAIHYFVQYHLYKQFNTVLNYAHAKGVAFKGDIAIGVSPFSVDVWMQPELFNQDMQAGAPPDDFALMGQNWRFPTYNWERMAMDGYAWWKKRLQHESELFDAYRIDHILGFFRIWEIPQSEVSAMTGHFYPSIPLSVEEVMERGLVWDEKRFMQPYLQDHVLKSIFKRFYKEAINEYFINDELGCRHFKDEVSSPQLIASCFEKLRCIPGSKEQIIRDGLYALHADVLFVRDNRMPDKFHPRILLENTYSYQDLPSEIKHVVSRIYIDYFYHRHNAYWKDHAVNKLLPLIDSNQMMVCGEDLGMLPDNVPEVMNQLEILSLEVQRMPKKSQVEFGSPVEYPYLSVCTTSTHDMNPLRAWWLEDPQKTQRFYNAFMNQHGKAPATCNGKIAEHIIHQHVSSSAMWVILPLQDWLSMDEYYVHPNPFKERINIPSDSNHHWNYRMHIPLEELINATELNNKLKYFINQRKKTSFSRDNEN